MRYVLIQRRTQELFLGYRDMTVEQTIEKKVKDTYALSHYEIINESSMHNVPPNAETHFKVVLVSDEFQNLKLIERHRKLNELLKDELANGIHALSLHLFTQDEWAAKEEQAKESPLCAKK